uniref:Uncharacterized protein n=1 Tax=Meloidogyne enterolobii TaxID=390850 RepID=A0A6V7UEZ3_MELEN|nr:unnamed protein product [Meloidogyne enterolobii]
MDTTELIYIQDIYWMQIVIFCLVDELIDDGADTTNSHFNHIYDSRCQFVRRNFLMSMRKINI